MGRIKKLNMPDAEGRDLGAAFLLWFGANRDRLKYCISDFDEDLFSDTMIKCYDSISSEKSVILDYKGFFIRAYRTVFIDAMRAKRDHVRWVPPQSDDDKEPFDLAETGEEIEKEVENSRLRVKMLRYINHNYPPEQAAVFEIWEGLYPSYNYAELACLLNFPHKRVRQWVNCMRRDLRKVFNWEVHEWLD